MKKSYLLLALAYGLLLWILSGRPGGDGLLPHHWDKLAHFAGYGLLGCILSRGMGRGRFRGLAAWFLAASYGLLDEYHQSFVPGRHPSILDALADAAGSAGGVVLCQGRRWRERRALRTASPGKGP